MMRLIAIVCFVLSTNVHAAEPQLSVYVTDDNADVFVLISSDQAMELSGCSSATQARQLLALPAEITATESTLGELATEHNLGSHPAIPCSNEVAFDIDWPATTPIWVDFDETRQYYLPSPDGGALFYAIPIDCHNVKSSIALRARVQLPGVLQNSPRPQGHEEAVVLACGTGFTTAVENGGSTADSSWSLHEVLLFLSDESQGDNILVAQSRQLEHSSFLPIWRINGLDVSAELIAGGSRRSSLELEVKKLFGVNPEKSIDTIAGADIATIRESLFLDICTQDCTGYNHQNALFVNPTDTNLTQTSSSTFIKGTDLIGREIYTTQLDENRNAVFVGCQMIIESVGEIIDARLSWADSMSQAIAQKNEQSSVFVCQSAGRICRTEIAEGQSIPDGSALGENDCEDAQILEVLLPDLVIQSGPINLLGTRYSEINFMPKEGIERSVIAVEPGGSPGCLVVASDGLIIAKGLGRLTLSQIDLRSTAIDTANETIAITLSHGQLVLEDVTVGINDQEYVSVERGVNLCQSEMYSHGSELMADDAVVQALDSKVLINGTQENRAALTGRGFGILVSPNSEVLLNEVNLSAVKAVRLNGASYESTRTDYFGTNKSGDAFHVSGNSNVMVHGGVIEEFRCVSVIQNESSMVVRLPGNDITIDNRQLSCGSVEAHLQE